MINFNNWISKKKTITSFLFRKKNAQNFLFSIFSLQFNQDLYTSSGVPLTSSSASASSHSPCSPILPPSIALNAAQTAATTIPTIPLGNHHQRSVTKEEDLSNATRNSDTEGKQIVYWFMQNSILADKDRSLNMVFFWYWFLIDNVIFSNNFFLFRYLVP